MKEYKLFAQRVGLVGLTKFVNRFQGVILLPILTKNMSVGDYGIWAQIMVTIGLIPSLMSLGLSQSMVRFMPSVKNKVNFQDMFYSFLSVITLTGIFASLGIYLMSEQIADLLFDGDRLIVEVLALVVFFEGILKLLLNYFRATQQIKRHSMLTVAKNVLTVVIVAFFVLQGEGIFGAVKGLLITIVIMLLIALLFIIRDLGLKVPKFNDLRQHLAFGIPTESSTMSKWILNSSDRYVISGFLGTSAVGYYSPGYTLGTVLQMFVAPLNFMLPMILSKHYDGNNLEEVKRYLSYSLKYFLAIAIPAAFGLSLLSRQLLEILSTPEIAEQGYFITPFVAIGAIFFGIFSVFEKVAMLVKKTKVIGTIWVIAAALNLGLNMLLIPHIGIIAAAATTLLSFTAALGLMARYSLRYLQFDMDFAFILKSVFASVLMSGIILLWNPSGLFAVLGVIGACVVFYFVILILLKGFNKEEFKFFKECISSS
ncbi:flippase [Methanohalophilus portucalensis]|uniref:Flippase n=2 Tax=Methanohalophilus portucalensis TaxID=39664 RepID=A0A1L9C4Z0_9EURY|nr:flippase [Methanohalophilus portucalensis]ATU08248.1 polysaccharide biosynthesis protein [Methanohalophilus portucalensis]OJH49564.1 polysaccharide biosynthesis protein [Methanohalophilus portucalensis FDF-1]RNI13584.1 flippase [Methanohalophilus portucalensis FDF-1]SMH35380.1 Membrane protein involved in the export of O-antigen and teichoic acid [Methanohalophilus portucalensis FDF-1]